MLHITAEELKRKAKRMGYKGCKNCSHRTDTGNMCDWRSQGGDGHLHFFCPKWEKKYDENLQSS